MNDRRPFGLTAGLPRADTCREIRENFARLSPVADKANIGSYHIIPLYPWLPPGPSFLGGQHFLAQFD